MPMLILAIRVESDLIFKMNYKHMLGKKGITLESKNAFKEIEDN